MNRGDWLYMLTLIGVVSAALAGYLAGLGWLRRWARKGRRQLDVMWWANGMVMVFNAAGLQVPEYQGPHSEVWRRVLRVAGPRSRFFVGRWAEYLEPITRAEFAAGGLDAILAAHDLGREKRNGAGDGGPPGAATLSPEAGHGV